MCDILEYRGIDRFIPDMICFAQISLFVQDRTSPSTL